MAIEEEFSIEIPDKEADAIHSGMCIQDHQITSVLTNAAQWNKQLPISSLNPMLTKQFSRTQRRSKNHKVRDPSHVHLARGLGVATLRVYYIPMTR